jgi:uncharacterized protein (TIGR02246 family)
MNNLRRLFGVMIVVGLGLGIAVAPCLAQEIDPRVDAEIMEMIMMHDKALSEQDLAAVMATYAPTGTIVLMGTGPGERWVGREEIEDAYRHFFQDFDTGSLRTELTWRALEIRGNIAWMMVMLQFTDYLKNQKREYAANISVVVEQLEGQWYIRTFHFSNLTGGE